MKSFLKILTLILLSSGCSSNNVNSSDLIILPKSQQEAYLSRSKSTHLFGFSVFGQPNGAVGVKGQTRLHPNHKASVKMQKNNLPIIPISGKNNAGKSFALLDFSSPSSWIDFKQSQEYDVHFLAYRERNIPYVGNFNTGKIDAYMGVVSQLRIDQLFLENTPIYVKMSIGSLEPQSRGIANPNITTVIGYDILKVFNSIQLDFDSNVIRFTSSEKYQPNESLLIGKTKIIEEKNRGLVVEGNFFGKLSPVVLDLAGDYYLTVPQSNETITRQLSFGALVFRKIPTQRFDSMPRAGKKLFEDLIVTVCPNEKIVYFEHVK